jgi:hypothetical protein
VCVSVCVCVCVCVCVSVCLCVCVCVCVWMGRQAGRQAGFVFLWDGVRGRAMGVLVARGVSVSQLMKGQSLPTTAQAAAHPRQEVTPRHAAVVLRMRRLALGGSETRMWMCRCWGSGGCSQHALCFANCLLPHIATCPILCRLFGLSLPS